jgi:protein TonB
MAPFIAASFIAHVAFATAAMFFPAVHTQSRSLPDAIPVSMIRLSGPKPAPVKETTNAVPAKKTPAPVVKKKKPVVPADMTKKPTRKKKPPQTQVQETEQVPDPTPGDSTNDEPVEEAAPASDDGPEPEFTGPGTGDGSSSVASLDILGSEFDWYTSSITAKLKQHWNRPLLGGVRETLTVVVSFTIQSDGRVTDVDIQSSSGVPSIDRSALRAIIDAAPLPRIPPQLRENTLPARFEFRWHPGR